MKRVTLFAALLLSILPLLSIGLVYAQESPKLVISQFKITTKDGQFFMLHNASDEDIDMGSVQLVYYNNFNLADATSSKVIGLSGNLEPGGYYLVNDGPYTLCYQMIVNSASLGLSSTSGTVVVQSINQAGQGQAITTTQHDYISWSKAEKEGVQQLPENNQSLLRRPVDEFQHPSIPSPGFGSWIAVSQSINNPCALETIQINEPPQVIETSILLLPSTPPPVTVLGRMQTASTGGGAYMPAGNIGLMTPVINELLPNPGSPQTDAEDEFIELYNPNSKSFELTGFEFKVGLNSKRSYKFPAGTILEPNSFTAFYSSDTNIALNNSGSQVELVDPFGNIINTSEPYGKMKDNIAWALANNEWLATAVPTPGKQNIINGEATASAVAAGSSNTQRRTTGAASSSDSANGVLGSDAEQKVADIRPSTLAGVAGMALGYGAYEYRTDAANKFREFRANRSARRKAGS